MPIKTDDTVAGILAVVVVVDEHLAARGERSGSGTVPCPVCRMGAVRYQAHPIRRGGRLAVRAVCSTEGCVRFMS